MEAVKGVKCVIINGERRQEWTTVLRTDFYDLIVNGKKVAELEAIPHSLRELAIGYLLTNGYIQDAHSVERVRAFPGRIEVTADPEFEFRFEYLGNSPLEKVELKPLTNGYTLNSSKILEKFERGLEQAYFFKNFGYTEFAIVSDDNGALFVGEGITGMEAFYKAIGKSYTSLFDLRRAFILFSTSLLPEYVVRAALIGIPIVGSVKGISSLALELAEALNVTTFTIEGEERKVFTHPVRLR